MSWSALRVAQPRDSYTMNRCGRCNCRFLLCLTTVRLFNKSAILDLKVDENMSFFKYCFCISGESCYVIENIDVYLSCQSLIIPPIST